MIQKNSNIRPAVERFYASGNDPKYFNKLETLIKNQQKNAIDSSKQQPRVPQSLLSKKEISQPRKSLVPKPTI